MPDTLYVLTLLKIGSAGLAFWFYASQTFKINGGIMLRLLSAMR